MSWERNFFLLGCNRAEDFGRWESLRPLPQQAKAVIVKMVSGFGGELGEKKRVFCKGREFSYCHWKEEEFGESEEEEVKEKTLESKI